jgi:hypothetical protein
MKRDEPLEALQKFYAACDEAHSPPESLWKRKPSWKLRLRLALALAPLAAGFLTTATAAAFAERWGAQIPPAHPEEALRKRLQLAGLSDEEVLGPRGASRAQKETPLWRV